MPALLFDTSGIDMDHVAFDQDAILEVNPQSFEKIGRAHV